MGPAQKKLIRVQILLTHNFYWWMAAIGVHANSTRTRTLGLVLLSMWMQL